MKTDANCTGRQVYGRIASQIPVLSPLRDREIRMSAMHCRSRNSRPSAGYAGGWSGHGRHQKTLKCRWRVTSAAEPCFSRAGTSARDSADHDVRARMLRAPKV